MGRTAKPGKIGPLAKEARRQSLTFSNMLAQRLHEAITKGEFAVGDTLPSERELMATYQCSRATVREALRVLRAQDMIEVKRGRSGGSFVSSPNSLALVRSLNQFISGHEFRFSDLVAAREAIEPAAATQAAQRRSAEGIERLRVCSQNCEDSVHDIQGFVEANLDWHLSLAQASGNPLFVAFLTSISTAMHAATAFEEFDLKVRKAVVGVHWQIFDAIQSGDADAARRRTMRHLSAYEEKLATIA